MKKTFTILAAGVLLAACDAGAKVNGMASDGETFTGTAVATGYWDASGTINLVSNRGLTCVGTYAYVGLGPTGKATFNCTDGRSGELTLDANASTGEGTIGTQRLTVRWGSVRG
ncbi:hypothetical protein [uncultured Reyranella sp.]|uniref:hypothetical protein n=1 Tax=uncultured Reyranella sp. TaxID=735512 RepID=UPI00259C8DD8|nr:hypothetical protein [uncultured Reyranella sp.]